MFHLRCELEDEGECENDFIYQELCVPADTVLKGCPNLGPPLSYQSAQFVSFRWYNQM